VTSQSEGESGVNSDLIHITSKHQNIKTNIFLPLHLTSPLPIADDDLSDHDDNASREGVIVVFDRYGLRFTLTDGSRDIGLIVMFVHLPPILWGWGIWAGV
jgi:hypothetical protein